jgi:TolB-like protein
VVDTAGDCVLTIFKTAAGAITAALAIQRELEANATAVPEHRRLRFRLGLHLGDVVQKDDGSVYGDGVNVAARLQSIAPAGGIVASESIRLAVRGKVAARFEDLGEHSLKNIPDSVRAHRVIAASRAGAAEHPSPAAAFGRDSERRPIATAVFRGLVTAALTTVVAGAAYFGIHLWRTPSLEPPGTASSALPLSILVLPFANQTGDESKAYIADALTTSIAADMSRIRGAFVVPSTTAFTYRGKGLTVQQIGKDAGVRFVLDGSVMTRGQDVRVTTQLLDAKTGAQLWHETIDGDLSNVFAIQDRVTALVGSSIGERMVIVSARDSEARKRSPKVADLMLRARALELQPQSIQNLREGERLYREAISLDPNNLDAAALLASALAMRAMWLDSTDPIRGRLITEARDLALKVKAIDPEVRGIDTPLQIYAIEHGDFDGARRSFEARLVKEPRSPAAYTTFAIFHRTMGEPEKAIPLLKQALAFPIYATVAWLMWVLGQQAGVGAMAGDSAKSFVKRRLRIPPGRPWLPFDQVDFVMSSLFSP